MAGALPPLRQAAPAEWSRCNVSLRLAVAPAWPTEPGGVGQPATRGQELIEIVHSRSRCAEILSVTSSCVVTHPPSAIGLDTVWIVRPFAVLSIVLVVLPSAIAASSIEQY